MNHNKPIIRAPRRADPESLTSLRDYLQDLTDAFDQAAHQAERRRRERLAAKRRYQTLLEAADVLAYHLYQGLDPTRAVAASRQLTGLDEEQLLGLMPLALKDLKRRRRDADDRRILQWVAAGISDAEIGRRLPNTKTGKPQHPKTINRRIKRIRDAARRLARSA